MCKYATRPAGCLISGGVFALQRDETCGRCLGGMVSDQLPGVWYPGLVSVSAGRGNWNDPRGVTRWRGRWGWDAETRRGGQGGGEGHGFEEVSDPAASWGVDLFPAEGLRLWALAERNGQTPEEFRGFDQEEPTNLCRKAVRPVAWRLSCAFLVGKNWNAAAWKVMCLLTSFWQWENPFLLVKALWHPQCWVQASIGIPTCCCTNPSLHTLHLH